MSVSPVTQVDSKSFLEDEKEVVEEVEEEDSGDEREDEIQTEKSKFMFLLVLGYFRVLNYLFKYFFVVLFTNVFFYYYFLFIIS